MFLLLEIIYRGTRFGSVSTVWHALSLSHAILALSAFPYGFSIYRSFRYRKGEYDKTKNKLSSAIDAYLQELMNSPNIAETLDNYAEVYNITDDGVRDFKGAKYRYN